MPRKVNRRKYKLPPTPPPPPESLFKKLINKTNKLLNEHPYIIFVIPIMYDLYNSYKNNNNINVNV